MQIRQRIKEHLSTSSTKLQPNQNNQSKETTQITPFENKLLLLSHSKSKLAFKRLGMSDQKGQQSERQCCSSRSEKKLHGNKYSRVRKNKSLTFLKQKIEDKGKETPFQLSKDNKVDSKIKRLQKLRNNICNEKNKRLKLAEPQPFSLQQPEFIKMNLIMSQINEIKKQIKEVKAQNEEMKEKFCPCPQTPQTSTSYWSYRSPFCNFQKNPSFNPYRQKFTERQSKKYEINEIKRPSSVIIKPKVTFSFISREDNLKRNQKARSVQLIKRDRGESEQGFGRKRLGGYGKNMLYMS